MSSSPSTTPSHSAHREILGAPAHSVSDRRIRARRYPADPPTVEEIVAVLHQAGDRPSGLRLQALIIILWRAGLRISEALQLAETDLEAERGAILVRRGKGGKRREVGMDRWAFAQLQPWLEVRRTLAVGPLRCVLHGHSAGRPWQTSAARRQLHAVARGAGARRRFAPHH
jgi:site-specific recombinase XerD